jgi:hypothetical protein
MIVWGKGSQPLAMLNVGGPVPRGGKGDPPHPPPTRAILDPENGEENRSRRSEGDRGPSQAYKLPAPPSTEHGQGYDLKKKILDGKKIKKGRKEEGNPRNPRNPRRPTSTDNRVTAHCPA